jgi:hypothetical protein
MHGEPPIVSLTSTWYIRPGQESADWPHQAVLSRHGPSFVRDVEKP